MSNRHILDDERGFTLTELLVSLSVMLIVLTAGFLLLGASTNNLNVIQNGSQASEANRLALDFFQRDLNRSTVLRDGVSPVLAAGPRGIAFAADVDGDGVAELVRWQADDSSAKMLRSVYKFTSTETSPTPLGIDSYSGVNPTTSTMLSGLDPSVDSIFTYYAKADTPYGDTPTDVQLSHIGLVSIRLRNALGAGDSRSVVDRSVSCRVMAFVVNGY
jgi:prepilin-type N-terminal cleavage/methylation domain-containing protein